MAQWAKSIVYLFPNPVTGRFETVFRLHLLFGMTVFLIFPFTRLVHVWSVPIGYLARSYQIVRSKKLKYQSR